MTAFKECLVYDIFIQFLRSPILFIFHVSDFSLVSLVSERSGFYSRSQKNDLCRKIFTFDQAFNTNVGMFSAT
jgi:hypothetical protein